MVRQLDVRLDDEFAKSLWLGNVSPQYSETIVTVANYWLGDEVTLEEQYPTYLARSQDGLNPWLEELFVSDLCAAEPQATG